MTGHTVARVSLVPHQPAQRRGSHRPDADKKADPKAPPTAPPIDPAALQAHLDATLPKLRDQLADAMAAHRLVAAGTPKDGTLPPGINPGHAYAVLGYDRETDRVQLWNPHGNAFHPKGEPGLQNGYPTKAGHFEMSLTDIGHVFNGITIETDQPADRL
jgi:hypothetical protein